MVLHLPLADMTPHDLWKRLNERGLPNIYVPGQRDFIQVPELPILGSGKLDLRKCKEARWSWLAARQAEVKYRCHARRRQAAGVERPCHNPAACRRRA